MRNGSWRYAGWSASVALFFAFAVSVLLAVTTLGAGIAGAAKLNVALLRTCKISSLRITVENSDGLSHGVEIITFKNVSGTSCKLSGYPKVMAILDRGKGPSNVDGMYAPAPAGTLKKATDTQYSWAGGVDVNDVPLKTFVAPTIILSPHNGVATSTLNWGDGPLTGGTCPAFNVLIIGVDGASVTRFVKSYELLCYEFAVTPIVEGKTGTMFVKADYSKKANDLSEARGEASSFRAEVDTLRYEMEHPHKFSFIQQMQAAESVQQTSQNYLTNTPWPKLNSSLKIVSREGEALGIHAVLSLMQSGHAPDLTNDYVRFLASMESLDEILSHLS